MTRKQEILKRLRYLNAIAKTSEWGVKFNTYLFQTIKEYGDREVEFDRLPRRIKTQYPSYKDLLA